MKKLNYTKGPWIDALYKLNGLMSGATDLSERYKLIARFDQRIERSEAVEEEEKNNMLLVKEAVNACIELNPDNPLEAAKGLVKAIQALRESRTQLLYLQEAGKRGTTASTINQIEIALTPYKND